MSLIRLSENLEKITQFSLNRSLKTLLSLECLLVHFLVFCIDYHAPFSRWNGGDSHVYWKTPYNPTVSNNCFLTSTYTFFTFTCCSFYVALWQLSMYRYWVDQVTNYYTWLIRTDTIYCALTFILYYMYCKIKVERLHVLVSSFKVRT